MLRNGIRKRPVKQVTTQKNARILENHSLIRRARWIMRMCSLSFSLPALHREFKAKPVPDQKDSDRNIT